jgi:hypothetical protein
MQTFLASFDLTPLHYSEYCARHRLTAYVPVEHGRDSAWYPSPSPSP